jgi:hypothetical protein
LLGVGSAEASGAFVRGFFADGRGGTAKCATWVCLVLWDVSANAFVVDFDHVFKAFHFVNGAMFWMVKMRRSSARAWARVKDGEFQMATQVLRERGRVPDFDGFFFAGNEVGGALGIGGAGLRREISADGVHQAVVGFEGSFAASIADFALGVT